MASDGFSALKEAFNKCMTARSFTPIADLKENAAYKIIKFERVTTQYGDTVLLTLEDLAANDDSQLSVYMPRRYNEVISDEMIVSYNTEGQQQSLHLIRRAAVRGNKHTPLEIC